VRDPSKPDHLAGQSHRPVMITVSVVWVMQMSVDKVVDVVSVRHSLMAAAWTVDVIRCMSGTGVAGRTRRGIRSAHGQRVLFHLAIRRLMMQVAIMQVVDMAVVLDSHMPTAGTVLMVMVGMLRHQELLQKVQG